MKTVTQTIILVVALFATQAFIDSRAYGQSVNAITAQPTTLTDAQLDSMLAPVALYPDTLLTHILIAATYPLDVIAAHRWRQANAHLTPQQVERALQNESWDPSVKAIASFTDLLSTMTDDLTWLGDMGNAVIADQQRVLSRVQVLRQQAWQYGSLSTNSYVNVQRDQNIIIITPASPRVVYVPYYDSRSVFGHWRHPHQPLYWRAPAVNRVYAGFHWSTGLYLSAGFYFGDIFWHDRTVVIRSRPHHYPQQRRVKRVLSTSYQRWQHHRPVRTIIKQRANAQRKVTVTRNQSRPATHRERAQAVEKEARITAVGNTSKTLRQVSVVHQKPVRRAEPIRPAPAVTSRHTVTSDKTASKTIRKHQKAPVKTGKNQSDARRAHH